MKITDIQTYVVDCYRTNFVFVKIFTDEGIHGVGEATLEYKEHAVQGAIEELKRYLIGKSPLDIEAHYHNIYRDAYWRGGAVLMSALSSVEMAMWDISAKALGVPVYRMLGGKVHEKVKVYANGWFAGAKTPEQFAEKAKETVARGFKGMKWDPFGHSYLTITHEELDLALQCISAVREAVGFGVDLFIEGHGRFNVPTAIQIVQEIAPFKPVWFEEPVPPDNVDALVQVRAKSKVAIAGGERLYTRYGFKDVFEKRALDYVQPDVSHAGGILEMRKIASIAESHHIPFAPHNPSGPIANAATLQIAACSPNFFYLEIMATDVPWRKDITNENLRFEDGYMYIPDEPGLGIDLNVEALKEHPYIQHDLRHYTGQLTQIRPPGAIHYF
ncbi:galactonate dehydratase [Paenibacillus roseipurpureus]|uniref:Galactonate dehydratase n=1 Tax=Paenibacillus roseopurpureus TaxID=2918901 RepID=A0AA96RH59_9BACL|nr:galactonate dehydratase [Paenibacillus sp. MBLB1832]WNR42963.1 galactonate dehydratase [Paenibacillus sp. MBLB1832]